MSAKEVRVGDRYGRLKVVDVIEGGDGTRLAKCACKCGGTTIVREPLLACGVTRSCGCRPARAKNLTHTRFGRLTALEPVDGRDADGSILWRCACGCGKEAVVSSNKLRMGHTRSCGCEKASGLKNSKTYIAGTCLEIIASEKLPKHNTSGVKGVARKRRKWQAYIMVSGRQYSLGVYATQSEACEARMLAEQAREAYIRSALQQDGNRVTYDALLKQYLDASAVRRDEYQMEIDGTAMWEAIPSRSKTEQM